MMQRSGSSVALDPSSDICPVCKSNRYLNPSLTFLINSECYHTMCTSCVDRLFTSGPAPCPVAGCHKTLRKRGFHAAFFADLGVEREVDVRRRIAATFNRRQEEFVGLSEWNDYLERVESLVFDIVNGAESERREAEEVLRDYAGSNKREIEESARAERELAEDEKRRGEAEVEAVTRRRIAAARQIQEEKDTVQRTRREVLDRLAGTTGDAKRITKQAEKKIQEANNRRRGDVLDAGAGSSTGFPIRGLKQKVHMSEKPYDAFDGLSLASERFVLQDSYLNEWLDAAKGDPKHVVGGYRLGEYYARTMFEAFSGLGVFVKDEFTGFNRTLPDEAVVTAVSSAASRLTGRNGNDVIQDITT
ncbi:MAG: TFIIH/NER complex subunit [Claussenomyces sp. TS43310]|nr:MAG: TFIIH/NER complex subunit [Claussenomyces sp. TS43310]